MTTPVGERQRHAGAHRPDHAGGDGRVDHPAGADVDGVDRHRRRDGLSHRALRGRGLHDLQSDRHGDARPPTATPGWSRPRATPIACGRPMRRATSVAIRRRRARPRSAAADAAAGADGARRADPGERRDRRVADADPQLGRVDECDAVCVAFGTTNPPAVVSSSQTATTYQPAALTANKKYFWRIVAKGAGGSTSGPVWSLTTAAAARPGAGRGVYLQRRRGDDGRRCVGQRPHRRADQRDVDRRGQIRRGVVVQRQLVAGDGGGCGAAAPVHAR